MTDRPLQDRLLATRIIEDKNPIEAADLRPHTAQQGGYRNFRKILRRVTPNARLLDERVEACRLPEAPEKPAADGGSASKDLRDARGHA